MKLQADKNPFNLGAKKFNSEELQKAHQEQVVRLETLLNEQTKRAEIFEKDKIALQQEMQSIIEQQNTMKTEDTNTINAITQTLESAQQQCKDLIDVIEMLTKENKHLQGRIDEAISQEFQEYKNHQTPTLDKATLLKQMEKLNKMLLDKSVQIDSLSYKLRHYENDIKELLEYRQLKCDVYKQDFKQCDNKEHTKSLLLMQNDLQNYRRIIEDKNQQILTLNSTNRELQEKIEEMLMQTRNEIQNLSHKYSLPQLEQMTRELKNAEEKVKELQEKLNTSEERRMSLVQKLEKNGKNIEKELNKDFESQLKNMKNITEKEKDSFQKQIMKLQKELDVSASEIKNLKQFTEKLIDENNTLKMEIKQKDNLYFEQKSSKDISESAGIKNEYVQLKEQLNRVMAHLQKGKVNQGNAINTAALKQDMEEFLSSLKEGFSKDCIEQKIKDWKTLLDMGECLPSGNLNIKQVNDDELHISLQKANSNIKRLEEALDDLRRAKTITEGEKCTFQFQLKDCESQLEQASKTIEYYKIEIENLTGLLKEKEDIINTMKNDYRYLKEQLNMKDSALKISEEDKLELRELLQKVKLQLEESEKEVLKMQNQITEIKEKSVRRNLEKELKEAENQLEQSRIEDGNVGDSEYFKNCLQAEVLKNELKLRDDLQREYLNKIKDVEAKYHKVCSATAEGYKEEIEKLKKQEIQYREQLSKILAECARKIYEFENEKQQLVSQINYVRAEYNEFKKRVIVNEGNYRQLIKMLQTDAERNADEWKKWSKQVVTNCLKLEAVNKSSRDKLVFGMKNADSEVEDKIT
ncbi:hypothetical protein NQ317_013019 [Molorchus minor]|uniref:Uncharacterized protein n=1 Tax=Molorchus minor TaxID=1323400 RepID=A0ABQ9K2I5_9CUCU|nr:hypothetical protein NQ317_013019 [Molorchus minor]